MSNTLNTYQLCAEEYLGDIQTNINRTTADRFEIGYTPANDLRGVDIGATTGVANSAYIDFNSLDNGTNDYDTRIVSVGGELGTNGRGILQMSANEYHLLGNSVEPEPEYKMPGYVQMPAIPTLVGTLQGRQYAVRNYIWTGSGANDGANPVRTIQLRDPVSLTPWFGVLDVAMSSGFAGTGDCASYAGWVIAKNASPPSDIIECRSSEGTALAVLYAEADWNAGGYPQLKLFNKQAGSDFVYIVKITVFPDNDAF